MRRTLHVVVVAGAVLLAAGVLPGCSDSTPTESNAASLASASAGDAAGGAGAGPFGRLDLSDEQKEQIKTIRNEHRDAVRARRTELLGLDSEARREQLRAMHDELRSKIEAVFTDEQREKLEDMKNNPPGDGQRARHRRGQGGEPKGPPSVDERVDRLTEIVGLTEEQQGMIREILEHAGALRDNTDGDDMTRRERRQHRAITHDEVMLVLEDSQLEAFDEHLATRPRRGRGGSRGGR